MARTLQQQLDDLDAMIAKIEAAEGVAEYDENGGHAKFHALDRLYDRRERLMAQVAEATGGIWGALQQEEA